MDAKTAKTQEAAANIAQAIASAASRDARTAHVARFDGLYQLAHNDPAGNVKGLTLHDRIVQRAKAIANRHNADADDLEQAMVETVMRRILQEPDYTRQTYWRILNAATWKEKAIKPDRRHDRGFAFSLDEPIDASNPEKGTIGEAMETGDHTAILETTIATADVSAAMMKLPAQYRAIVLRTAIANQTQTEAAAALAISRAQLLRRRHRAIDKLRRLLIDYKPRDKGKITAAALARLASSKDHARHLAPRPDLAPLAAHEKAGDDRARAHFQHLEILTIEATPQLETLGYRLILYNRAMGRELSKATYVHPKTHLDYESPIPPPPPMTEAEAARLAWIEDNTTIAQTPPPRPRMIQAIAPNICPPQFPNAPFTPPPPRAPRGFARYTPTPPASAPRGEVWSIAYRRPIAFTPPPSAAQLAEKAAHEQAEADRMLAAIAAAPPPPPPLRPYRRRRFARNLSPAARCAAIDYASAAKAAYTPITYTPTPPASARSADQANQPIARLDGAIVLAGGPGDERQLSAGDAATGETGKSRRCLSGRPSAARLALIARLRREAAARPPART